MFAHILVAMAEAEDATETMHTVSALASAFSAEVTLFHARERVVGPRDEVKEEETLREAHRYGELIASELRAAGVRARLVVESVRPERLADLILAHADAERVDLIVIGGHHPHNLRQTVFGDIGKSLAHRAHCPVLLMPSAGKAAQPRRSASTTEAT
jgi:nucleotide-binding universal stress UspA family protein